MSEEITELAAVVDDILSMLKKVGLNVNDHRETTSKIHARLLSLQTQAQERISEANQRRILFETLLMSMIGEMIKSKTVDGSALAERFLLNLQSLSSVLQPHTHQEAKFLAEHISHPGFPDELPLPRGFGPTLVVDNDQPET